MADAEKSPSNISAGEDIQRPISPAESAASERPVAPKSSHQSYDGPDHHSHKEARGTDLNDALYKLVEVAEDAGAEATPPSKQTTGEKPGSFRARDYDEKKILAAIKKVPEKHDYSGYIFSSQSKRPKNMSNYFLPHVSQPTARQHIGASIAKIPKDMLHPNLKDIRSSLMPLSAVKLTWCTSVRHTVYTLSDLYAYLSRFGAIEGVYQRGPNSAVVIFCDLAAAWACVRCPALGQPWDPLMATWWEPRLHNHGYLEKNLREEERLSMSSVLRDDLPDADMPVIRA